MTTPTETANTLRAIAVDFLAGVFPEAPREALNQWVDALPLRDIVSKDAGAVALTLVPRLLGDLAIGGLARERAYSDTWRREQLDRLDLLLDRADFEGGEDVRLVVHGEDGERHDLGDLADGAWEHLADWLGDPRRES